MSTLAEARAEAARLYVEDMLSVREIGERMTPPRSGEGVRLLLIAAGVKLRPPGDKYAGHRGAGKRQYTLPPLAAAGAGSWTPERVDLLKNLWADGLSCSQIAKRLGGVTRNAVIGKVTRLGLAGRAVPSKPKRVTVVKAQRVLRPALPRVQPGQLINAAMPPVAEPIPAHELAPTCDLLGLGAHMCRWPIGDPAHPTFGFCGRKTDGTYCETHKPRSVDNASAASKRTVADLTRSLRRYVA